MATFSTNEILAKARVRTGQILVPEHLGRIQGPIRGQILTSREIGTGTGLVGPDRTRFDFGSGPSFPALEFGQVVAVAGRKQWFRRARYS